MAKRRTDSRVETREADLTDMVERLTQEVRVLRQSIDEFREDFVHLLRNLPDNLPPPYAHLGTLAESFAIDVPKDSPKEDEQPAATSRSEPPARAAPTTSAMNSSRRTSLFD